MARFSLASADYNEKQDVFSSVFLVILVRPYWIDNSHNGERTYKFHSWFFFKVI